LNLLLNIREALRALMANKLRSLLTTLGIIFGVASVVVMVAIGTGTQQRIQEQIEALGTDVLQIYAGVARSSGVRMGTGSLQNLTDDDARALQDNVPYLLAVAPLVRGRAHVVSGNANWSTTLTGTTEAFLDVRDWHVSLGRGFLPDELDAGRKVAIIGQTVAEKLFPGEEAINRTMRLNHLTFEIIGILESKGQTMDGSDLDDVVLAPLKTARNLVLGRTAGRARSVTTIMARVVDEAYLPEAEAGIRDTLRQRQRLQPDQEDGFRVLNMSEYLKLQEASSSALTALLAAVASISLLVGGIGIMNIMLVSVTERTREIGIRMAIGATPRDLLSQFLVEALTLSFIGAVIGATCGIVGSIVAEQHFNMRTALTLEPILISTAFAAGVGIVFGFYPAWTASRLQPIEALRYD
jgi:putative ABC transport system permease protein